MHACMLACFLLADWLAWQFFAALEMSSVSQGSWARPAGCWFQQDDPPRVDGLLSCSRALGAFELKQQQLPPEDMG